MKKLALLGVGAIMLVALFSSRPKSNQPVQTQATQVVHIPIYRVETATNLHTDIGPSSEVLKVLQTDLPMAIIGEEGNWKHILLKDGTTGWISDESISFVEQLLFEVPSMDYSVKGNTDFYNTGSGSWILGFGNFDGSSDYYDTNTGDWELGFRNFDGSSDFYNTGSGSWRLGFGNSDGSSDYYGTRNGSWELGFRNYDGSSDYYDMNSGSWRMGFKNYDGSSDYYDTGNGSWQMGFGNSSGSTDSYSYDPDW